MHVGACNLWWLLRLANGWAVRVITEEKAFLFDRALLYGLRQKKGNSRVLKRLGHRIFQEHSRNTWSTLGPEVEANFAASNEQWEGWSRWCSSVFRQDIYCQKEWERCYKKSCSVTGSNVTGLMLISRTWTICHIPKIATGSSATLASWKGMHQSVFRTAMYCIAHDCWPACLNSILDPMDQLSTMLHPYELHQALDAFAGNLFMNADQPNIALLWSWDLYNEDGIATIPLRI